MKKVKVLFSAFAVVALIAGVVAAKATEDQFVYTYNTATGICDIPLNATLVQNGLPILHKSVTLTPSPVATDKCTVRDIFQAQ